MTVLERPMSGGVGQSSSMAAAQGDPIGRLRPAQAGSGWFPAGIELVRQLALIAAAAVLYFAVRGQTEGGAEDAIANGLDVLRFEQRFGLDLEHWAQALIVDHDWLVTAANWIYIWGHWPIIAVTLFWLHRTRRADFLVLRNALFISGAIGLVFFATYAVAPPRLAGIGLIDTVTDNSEAYRVLQPPSLVNKYAAIPSLHVGWNFLVGIALYRAGRGPLLRFVAVAGPILMAIAVVVTANHYVIDGIIGLAVASVGLVISQRVSPQLTALDRRLRLRWSGAKPSAGQAAPGH